MSTRFNPKVYLGKDKVQSPIQKGISKYWVWNQKLNEYICRSYVARKSTLRDGLIKIIKEHFDSLEEARLWLYGAAPAPTYSSILFDQALKSWLEHEVSHRAKTTQAYYLKALKFFNFFAGLHMEQINPMKVDEWILFLKENNRNEHRFTFERELSILSQILKYHSINNYGFINPVNSNHNKKVKVKDIPPKNKDFLEPDFIIFREELLKLKNGLALATLATVEYYHALRIGEGAGLFWEDITFNDEYHKRKIKIVRSVKWIRNKNKETFIEDNFKNSKSQMDGTKEYIVQPEVYEYLLAFKDASNLTTGLIFQTDGKPWDYRHSVSL